MVEHAPRKGEVAVRFRVGAAQLAQWQGEFDCSSKGLWFDPITTTLPLPLFFWGLFFFGFRKQGLLLSERLPYYVLISRI